MVGDLPDRGSAMNSALPPGGRILRIIGIILMALAVAFNLLGGIGTSCVTLNPMGWSPAMAKLAPYQWLYILTLFTLAVMLLFRLPPIWKAIGGFRRGGPRDFAAPAGLAAFAGGLVALTTPLWASPTHIGPDGANWVSVLRTPLLAGGIFLATLGVALVWWSSRQFIVPAASSRESRSARGR
jgi:hypothetical protein